MSGNNVQPTKEWGASGVLVPAGLLIGIGVGFLIGHLVAGLLIGLGAGLLVMAVVHLAFGK
jgi:hypothetical protein